MPQHSTVRLRLIVSGLIICGEAKPRRIFIGRAERKAIGFPQCAAAAAGQRASQIFSCSFLARSFEKSYSYFIKYDNKF